MPENRAARTLSSLVVLLTLAATLGMWFDLRGRIETLATRVDEAGQAQQRLERAVQLFRFERGSKGLGVKALIEQLHHWAPMLELSTTPQKEIPVIEQRVGDIISALRDLGRDAYQPLAAEFAKAEPGKDDELSRWLLQALISVDVERAKELLVACVRGYEFPVTSRIRVIAAERLLELDRPRTAALLSDVLSYESATGVDQTRMSPDQQAKLAAAKVKPQPMRMLFNFVDTLVKAGASDLEDRLIMVASRPGQDRMTVQTCVRHLGDLKAKGAVKLLQKLYDNPPEMMINPIFQNHCLEAIARIDGAAACDYFRTMLRGKPDEIVQAKLQELIKTLCP